MRWHFFIKILLVLLLVISLNELASEHYVRRDFSRSHRFSLSEQGSVLFSGIQRPAHMIIYFSPNSSTEGSELFEDLEALMQEYQIKGRENLIVEYLDPIRDLGRARELQRRYHFNPNENVVIIDYMDHSKIISFKELGDYDGSNSGTNEPPHLFAFRGEQVINAALIELSGIPLKKIYYLQGHGEKIPGIAPIELIGHYLQHQHIDVQPLNLATNHQQVPEDAALVMILGASFDLSQEEAEVLKNYWKHSGRLLILLDPTATTPHLLQVTQQAGIQPRGDRLMRLYPSGSETTTSRDIIGIFVAGCELTKQFLGLNIVFSGPTESLDLTSQQFQSPVEWEATNSVSNSVMSSMLTPNPNSSATAIEIAQQSQRRPLIQAVPGFWGYREAENGIEKDLLYLPSKEEKNLSTPLVIAAIADLGALHDDRVAVSAARMIVVGNSDFIQDQNIGEVDLDFFSSSVNGLIDRVQLTGNTTKMKAYFTLNLPEEQMQQIVLWTMFIIPLLGAFIGFMIFWRRRS